jgi:hypothetical protein
MTNQESSLGLALGAKGWKTNLQIVLHLLVYHVQLRNGMYESMYRQKTANHHALVFNLLPAHCILAVRHSTFMVLETFTFLDRAVSARRVNVMEPVSEATTRSQVEDQLRGTIAHWYQSWKTGSS